MSDFSQELKRILMEEGCFFKRQGKGSHEIWYSPKSGRSFPIQAKVRKRHLANEILKQAGLNKRF
ncbi:MAG: type II toxin-antitoxin system HicA family toxin [Candidatus Dadabacteria bacterium]|nr:type II toxin-antitoxin system HicA family toxin [Candidatus Dadabacteria bacterium]